MTKIDNTFSKHYVKMLLAKIETYEEVRNKKSTKFKYVKDFFKAHKINPQFFYKVYGRYKHNPEPESLLPKKRGPKFKTRRTDIKIEEKVIKLRKTGLNRYEIHEILKQKLKNFTPSPSCIYNICKRYGLNKLKKQQKQERKKIIMDRIGQLIHIDCHYLPKGTTFKEYPRLYLLGIIDGYSRLAWVEVVEDIKGLTVMFSTLRCLNMLKSRYGIEAEAIMTDNGAEFGSGKNKGNKMENPFERMLIEMEIKHRYTKPYRPQTNGKIERFWKTLKEDMLDDADYDDIEDLRNNLLEYLIYYNEHRPHQSLGGNVPMQFILN